MQPRRVITSPEWSGIDEEGRAYAAFTINVEREKPWHTLSGRMHLYLDHAWMRELGEGLPAYRPPVDHRLMLAGAQPVADDGVPEVTLRYLTPHSKWSIHSEYQDNLHMLTLFRGGSGLWMSPQDAEAIGVADNDWVEAHNRNGIVVTRAVVSHRVPEGVCLMYHSKDRQIGTPRSRDRRPPRRHRERADDDRDEADAHDRRLRAALVGRRTTTGRPAPTATR